MATRLSSPHREPGYIFYHGERTARMCGELLELVVGEDAEFGDEVFAAAVFHDVGKGFDEHHLVGAEIAVRLLSGLMDPTEIESIKNIVSHHCLRDPARAESIEVALVQDADMIDHFGTQEIWLRLSRCIGEKRSAADFASEWSGAGTAESRIRCRELLNFDVSKKIYDERIKYADEFMNRFAAESV